MGETNDAQSLLTRRAARGIVEPEGDAAREATVLWIGFLAVNAVIWVAYWLISAAIFRGLVRTKQLGKNRLGLATAIIFATCGAGHAYHALHVLLPAFGVLDVHLLAARAAVDWHLVLVDLITGGVALWYWSLRSTYGAVLQAGTLFDDVKARQRQALELNDNVVQGLAVAKYALEAGDDTVARAAVEHTLASARDIVSDLLGADGKAMTAGDLVRERAATVLDRRPA